MKMFHSRSLKTSFKGTSLPFFILWNNLFVSCTRILLWKKDSMKELCKNHLKIFLIKLCGILHARRKDHFCFYKYFTNQTFTFINSKVVYVKKHLAYQVYHLDKTKFLLPLNVLYRHQTIKLAVGTMAEPLRTWLKGAFRNLSTQNAISVYSKETWRKRAKTSHSLKEINLRDWKSWRKKMQCNRFSFISVTARKVFRFSSIKLA